MDREHVQTLATADDLTAIYALLELKHFGPQKFKAIAEAGLRPRDVIEDPGRLPLRGKRGEEFKAALSQRDPDGLARWRSLADRQLETAEKAGASILTYDHPGYPHLLFESNYPVPMLFARGAVEILRSPRAIACVGSRQIRPPYAMLHQAFATTAASNGTTVVSGFAVGADRIGHEAARQAGGTTVCVMPGGLERAFPPENRDLWNLLLEEGSGVFVSEAGFGVRASSLLLRKRNKLIVALSQRVLVSQSSDKGGAMNAFRFGLELKRPVATFQDDGEPDTSGNRAIARDTKSGSTVFGLEPDERSYLQWLHGFSSST
jgi:DNA protecting protein DprA